MNHFAVYKSPAEFVDLKLPLYVFHHGAGHTAKSFQVLTEYLQRRIPCNVLAFDCRGHGATRTENEGDLSIDRLVEDLAQIVNEHAQGATKIILVGHSMGAAVVVNLMDRQLVKGVIGTCVIDVVEGTALEALSVMNTWLQTRPESFRTMQDAIEWTIRSNQIRNRESANISVPAQLIEVDGVYKWRTDLVSSSPYWHDWFKGLSDKLLRVRGARLLVLAGTDRLDKPLMIGQMQGKFQLEIIPDSGHCVQEDSPQKLADILATFYERNQPLDISKIKKVSS